jgi:hypothetical protein
MSSTQHVRLKVYESKGLTSGVLFFKYECSCSWLGFDVSDIGIAREDWKRHARSAKRTAQEAAA